MFMWNQTNILNIWYRISTICPLFGDNEFDSMFNCVPTTFMLNTFVQSNTWQVWIVCLISDQFNRSFGNQFKSIFSFILWSIHKRNTKKWIHFWTNVQCTISPLVGMYTLFQKERLKWSINTLRDVFTVCVLSIYCIVLFFFLTTMKVTGI